MSKILINYTYNKKKDTYTILENEYVFADLPIAVMDTDIDYNEVLIVPLNNINTVVDKASYLSTHKKFKLGLDEKGNVLENEEGTEVWLPINTDLSKLKYINNQLIMVEDDKENIKED